jgi:hypothetical protein
MGSTVCVRCGATLIPYSYCGVCQDVLRFVCSSCLMYTDERIHAYCRNARVNNNNSGIYLKDTLKLMEEQKSYQLLIDDNPVNTHYYIQKQFNDKIKDSSIKLLTSYWFNIFESIKLINRYWSRIFNISNSSSLA